MSSRRVRRGQRGVVFPSPVVLLSVVAVAMAAVAFLVTQGSPSPEREITSTAQQQSPSATGAATSSGSPATSGSASSSGSAAAPSSTSVSATPKPSPSVVRASTSVVVFNNSRVSGLAAQVATKVGQVGWQVVGADNWYGTIPATTVYYPSGMKSAGKQLALDLGITRTAPAVDPMRADRLTVILTGPLA